VGEARANRQSGEPRADSSTQVTEEVVSMFEAFVLKVLISSPGDMRDDVFTDADLLGHTATQPTGYDSSIASVDASGMPSVRW